MRKGTEVIGLTVVTFDTGEKLDSVNDIVFDQDSNHVLALVVDEGGWTSNARVVPFEAIQTIGPDAVIITTAQAVIDASHRPRINDILERNNILKGTAIMTTDGRELGELSDIYFDEATGAVEGYETSGGIFADAYTGRSFIPAKYTLRIGEDAAFVPPEVIELMEEHREGGLKDQLEQLRNQTAPADAETTATIRLPLETAKGLRAQQPVRTEQGMYIVTTGQIVDDPHIERAKRFNKEDELLEAVGLLQEQADQSTPQSHSEHDQSPGLWANVKQKVASWQDKSSQKIEAERINEALGRPVNRVILDDQDRVILNTGEIITHEAIEQARRNKVLDVLLDSVYDHEPRLTVEQARADTEGRASLD